MEEPRMSAPRRLSKTVALTSAILLASALAAPARAQSADETFVSLSGLVIRQGGLSIAASRGNDQVFVRDSTIGGRLNINSLGGDDEIRISGLSLFSGGRVNAAKGNDSLEIDAATVDNSDATLFILGVETQTAPTPDPQ